MYAAASTSGAELQQSGVKHGQFIVQSGAGLADFVRWQKGWRAQHGVGQLREDGSISTFGNKDVQVCF